MRSPADRFVGKVDGPAAIVRFCRLCGHRDVVPKPPRIMRPGRGWGFREGNKQRGRLIRHVREAHPEALKEATK